jgi:hypothetical protein
MDENKDITINDFVLEHKNFMSKEWCETAIKYFEQMNTAGFSYKRLVSKDIKDDTSIDFPGIVEKNLFTIDLKPSVDLSKEFIDKFFEIYNTFYAKKYSVLQTGVEHGITSIKIQKTIPGEAYHVWHYESTNRDFQQRLSTFILYLNDVEDGGETEFLYYPRRIKPECGKLIIWPAGFPHTHRGNQPLSGEKYVLTGWLEFNK